MEKEAEEERNRKQKASAERAFQDGIGKAKLVLRRSPLGTDRNHNRSGPIIIVIVIVNRHSTGNAVSQDFFLGHQQKETTGTVPPLVEKKKTITLAIAIVFGTI